MTLRTQMKVASLALAACTAAWLPSSLPTRSAPLPSPKPWQRHTIDQSSRGADGVRLADINGDRLPDIATGWEEGGQVRLCLHPGPSQVRQPWPAVTVGPAPSVEDAVLCDWDQDGAWDVVSASEGRDQTIRIHWGPSLSKDILNPDAWITKPIPNSRNKMMWMFTVPLQFPQQASLQLFAAGKGPHAQIGWWSPARPARSLQHAQWHTLRPAGWIMSLIPSDMDGDGDPDLLFSDRKGPRSGCYWLENPGPGQEQARPWAEHLVGAASQQVMFLCLADLDQDGLQDVLAAVQPRNILIFRRRADGGRLWDTESVALPDQAGISKAVAVGDIDQDGHPDIVFSCEGAKPPRSGVMWLRRDNQPNGPAWSGTDISGPEGVKYDLIELIDLDQDGDLDVLTCEETANLGVVWYENPARSPFRK